MKPKDEIYASLNLPLISQHTIQHRQAGTVRGGGWGIPPLGQIKVKKASAYICVSDSTYDTYGPV